MLDVQFFLNSLVLCRIEVRSPVVIQGSFFIYFLFGLIILSGNAFSYVSL